MNGRPRDNPLTYPLSNPRPVQCFSVIAAPNYEMLPDIHPMKFKWYYKGGHTVSPCEGPGHLESGALCGFGGGGMLHVCHISYSHIIASHSCTISHYKIQNMDVQRHMTRWLPTMSLDSLVFEQHKCYSFSANSCYNCHAGHLCFWTHVVFTPIKPRADSP